MEPMSPDAGMAQLAQAYAAQAAGATGPEEMPAAGAELDVFARLSVAIDGATTEMRRQRQAARKAWEHCHPAPLVTLANNAAGTITDERWQPRAGWAWQLTRISVVSNAGGATAAALYQGGPGGEWLQNFTGTAGAFMGIWEPKGTFLLPGNQLVWTSTGGGITVNGQVIEISLDWLPTYLM